jgi:MAP/microtubule affinity-regulating kinase
MAVGCMHAQNVVHRDLKLDNILFDPKTGQIKIIDFGFSLKTKPGTWLDSWCGTPHYMCPEIVKKVPYQGFAADIWAAGVILYIMLCGKLPYFGEFEADLYRKIQMAKYTPVPSELGDHSVKSLFCSIFQIDPKLRPTADEVLNHPWLQK